MSGDLPPRSPLLEEWCPDLAEWRYVVTSDIDYEYNCIAWAAGDTTQQWWPKHGYWPEGVERELTVEAFVGAYATLGYAVCDGEDHEPGYEKIAIYADEAGTPQHAARQVDAEHWTSKCGDYWDISHPLRAIEGAVYGRVVRFMKRPG
jgi:hypothetical protein